MTMSIATSSTAAPVRRPTLRMPRWALSVAGGATFLIVWELVPRLGLVDPRFFPPISRMLTYLGHHAATAEFWRASGTTVWTWAIGLAISAAAGTALGVLFGMVPIVWRLARSTVEFLRPVPSVALLPVALLLFGAKTESTVLLVVYASVWPILVQVIAGIEDVDPIMKDTAASYRFSQRSRIVRVVWPTALPYAITGFRLSAATALVITVTGELLVSNDGIGGLFLAASQGGDRVGMFAYVIVAGLIGVIVNLVVRGIERVALFWHPAVRGEST